MLPIYLCGWYGFCLAVTQFHIREAIGHPEAGAGKKTSKVRKFAMWSRDYLLSTLETLNVLRLLIMPRPLKPWNLTQKK